MEGKRIYYVPPFTIIRNPYHVTGFTTRIYVQIVYAKYGCAITVRVYIVIITTKR